MEHKNLSRRRVRTGITNLKREKRQCGCYEKTKHTFNDTGDCCEFRFPHRVSYVKKRNLDRKRSLHKSISLPYFVSCSTSSSNRQRSCAIDNRIEAEKFTNSRTNIQHFKEQHRLLQKRLELLEKENLDFQAKKRAFEEETKRREEARKIAQTFKQTSFEDLERSIINKRNAAFKAPKLDKSNHKFDVMIDRRPKTAPNFFCLDADPHIYARRMIKSSIHDSTNGLIAPSSDEKLVQGSYSLSRLSSPYETEHSCLFDRSEATSSFQKEIHLKKKAREYSRYNRKREKYERYMRDIEAREKGLSSVKTDYEFQRVKSKIEQRIRVSQDRIPALESNEFRRNLI